MKHWKHDLIEVCRVFGLEALEKAPAQKIPKMLAKNYFADIAGINLQYALETYEWKGWRPITDDGVTVAGFWDSSKGPEVSRGISRVGPEVSQEDSFINTKKKAPSLKK